MAPRASRPRTVPARLSRLLERLGSLAVTAIGVTLLAFVVLSLAPGDPLAARADAERGLALDAARRARLERELGLDRPLPVRYLRWLGAACRGDLGRSWRTGQPVTREIAARLPATLELNLAALLLVLGIGAPLGWWMAIRAGTGAERTAGFLVLALYAVPSFWLALLLQQVLAVEWRILPLYGRPAIATTGLARHLRHLVLPALALGLHQLAFYARFARDTALAGLAAGHARLARALGESPFRIALLHGIRPSLVPLATLLGLLVPGLATGSVLIENIFGWPGLGRLFLQAVLDRDLPLVLGLTLMAGLLTVLGNLLADVLAALADPRLRAGAEDRR